MWLSPDKFKGELLKFLVLGDYGTGKSWFASTFPEPIYLLDFDKGSVGYARKRCFVPDIFSEKNLNVTQFIFQLEKELDALIKDKGEFKTLVLDSITTLTKMAMEEAVAKRPLQPGQPPIWNVHYPIAKVIIDRILDKIINFDGISIVIGHVEYMTDETTGTITSTPSLVGKLKTTVPASFDEVYVASVERTKEGNTYCIYLEPYGYHKARSRLRTLFPSIPGKIKNDWKEIEKHLKGGDGKVQKELPGLNQNK